MATRLTKHAYEVIAGRMVRDTLGKRYEAAKKKLPKYGNYVYNLMVSKAEQRLISKLGDDWFNTTDEVYVYVDMGIITEGQPSKKEFLRIPLQDKNGCTVRKPTTANRALNVCNPVLKEGDKLYKELRAIVDEIEECDYSAQRQAHETVLAAVRQFKTVEKLAEGWPEACKYLPDDMVQEKTTAVAICVDDINKSLGLPVDEEVTA